MAVSQRSDSDRLAVMTTARTTLVFVVFVAVAGLPSPRAQAAEADEARAFLDRATTAAALAHYDVAAENFEKAFELRPDPEVLYKAAEAHDLAGNKPRALALYRSFLRIYGRTGGSAMIEARIEALGGEAAPGRPAAVAAPPAPAFPPPPPQLGDADAGSATVDLRAERQERVHRRVQWLVLSIVVAGAGTAAAIGFEIFELKAENDYNTAITQHSSQARLDDLAQTGKSYSLYTNIGVLVTVVGLAGVGASVLSLVLVPRERKTALALTPAVGPNLLGGVAALRF
jgi:tetratricopeptide (TPR) repeat protein